MHFAYDLSQRHRVVTLNGEIIEVSGTITSNGHYPRRGQLRFTEDGLPNKEQ